MNAPTIARPPQRHTASARAGAPARSGDAAVTAYLSAQSEQAQIARQMKRLHSQLSRAQMTPALTAQLQATLAKLEARSAVLQKTIARSENLIVTRAGTLVIKRVGAIDAAIENKTAERTSLRKILSTAQLTPAARTRTERAFAAVNKELESLAKQRGAVVSKLLK